MPCFVYRSLLHVYTYGQVEYGMELVGDYGLYGRRAAEQDAAPWTVAPSIQFAGDSVAA